MMLIDGASLPMCFGTRRGNDLAGAGCTNGDQQDKVSAEDKGCHFGVLDYSSACMHKAQMLPESGRQKKGSLEWSGGKENLR